MNKSKTTPLSKQSPGSTGHVLVSVAILLHFSAIVLTYAANHTNSASPRRSGLQDQSLTALQPYLIGGNWYQEMLPIEWYSDDKFSKVKWVSVQFKNESDWIKVIESQSRSLDQSKQRQLLGLMWELVVNDNNDGISRIMLSMVRHLEAKNPQRTIHRIRFEKTTEDSLDESESVLFEGSIARFENAEIGLIPKIESRRSVKPTRSGGGMP